MKKSETAKPLSIIENKKVCVSLLFAALIYNIIFGCLRNPLGEDNTISWIGFDHPVGFILWGGLTAAALFFNISFAYRKFNYGGKLGAAALYIAPFMAASLVFVNDWGPEHVIHWIGAIGFIALNGAALLLMLLHNFKNHTSFKVTTGFVALMLLGMLVVLLTVGKSGILELVPLWLALILLFVINFTNLYPTFDKPKAPKEKNLNMGKAKLLALFLGMFGANDFYLGNLPLAVGHLFTTYVGFLICLDRFIGFGMYNNLTGELASTFLAAGLCVLAGSAAWALYDAFAIKKK